MNRYGKEASKQKYGKLDTVDVTEMVYPPSSTKSKNKQVLRMTHALWE